MTALLAAVMAGLLVVFVVLGVDDTRWRRRSRPRVRQRPPRVPYLPDTTSGPWQPEFCLTRGRRVRRARAYARGRYPAAYVPGSPPDTDPLTEETRRCRPVPDSSPNPPPPTSQPSSPTNYGWRKAS